MSNEADLLRMLEPAVRPGGLPAPAPQQRAPIESRDFESLLDEARSMNADTHQVQEDRGLAPSAGHVGQSDSDRGGLMGRLAAVDQIENSSLRQLLNGEKAS